MAPYVKTIHLEDKEKKGRWGKPTSFPLGALGTVRAVWNESPTQIRRSLDARPVTYLALLEERA